MSMSQKQGDKIPTPPDVSTVVLLIGTIGDTTWRMFVPTIGLTLLGVYGDNLLQMKPWLTVAGIILGTLIATLLIRNQLKKVKNK